MISWCYQDSCLCNIGEKITLKPPIVLKFIIGYRCESLVLKPPNVLKIEFSVVDVKILLTPLTDLKTVYLLFEMLTVHIKSSYCS